MIEGAGMPKVWETNYNKNVVCLEIYPQHFRNALKLIKKKFGRFKGGIETSIIVLSMGSLTLNETNQFFF